MARQKKTEIATEELENARIMWANFTVAIKYSIIGTSVILILLALFFIDFF